MSDEVVTVAREDGKKMRWGVNLLYRKEWQKQTIETKKFAWAITIVFAIVLSGTLFRSSDGGLYIEDKRLERIADGESEQVTVSRYSDSIKTQLKGAGSSGSMTSPSRLSSTSGNIGNDIPMGAEVKAKLITGATDGMVKVVLTEDLEVSGHTFLPEGTLLIGTGTSGDDRLNIIFTAAVFEDGTSAPVNAVAYDSRSKLLGLEGSVMSRRAIKLAAATGLNFIAGVSQGLEDVQVNQGITVSQNSVKNSLLRGAGVAALEQSKEMMGHAKDKQSVIYVKAGEELVIVFQGVNI